jgi:hypothetical protein
MHKEFNNYITHKLTGITVFCGPAMSGKTISLLNLAKNIKKSYPDSKLMFLDGEYGEATYSDYFDLKKINYTNQHQKRFSRKDIEELAQSLDYLFIDSPDYILSSTHSDIQESKKELDILYRKLNQSNCKIVIGASTYRSRGNDNIINNTTLSHIANLIIKHTKVPTINNNESIFSYIIKKNRSHEFFNKKEILFKLDSNLELFNNYYFPQFNLFQNMVDGWEETSLLKIGEPFLNTSFNNFLNTKEDYHIKLNNKQRYLFWDKLILDKSILHKEDIFQIRSDKNNHNKINYNYLNLFNLLHLTYYKDFNFNLFHHHFEELKFSFNQINAHNGLKVEYSLIKFLQKNISLKKSISLFKNFFSNNQKDGFNLLFALAIAYESLEYEMSVINDIDSDFINNYQKDLNLKYRINKKGSFFEIWHLLESELKKLETFKNENANKFFKIKMNNFYKINKDLTTDIYTIDIPLDLKDVIKEGNYFNNCTRNGFFIEKLSKNSSFLFYLKSNHQDYRDLCVYLDFNLDLIEIKCPDNLILDPHETKEFQNIQRKITI